MNSVVNSINIVINSEQCSIARSIIYLVRRSEIFVLKIIHVIINTHNHTVFHQNTTHSKSPNTLNFFKQTRRRWRCENSQGIIPIHQILSSLLWVCFTPNEFFSIMSYSMKNYIQNIDQSSVLILSSLQFLQAQNALFHFK